MRRRYLVVSSVLLSQLVLAEELSVYDKTSRLTAGKFQGSHSLGIGSHELKGKDYTVGSTKFKEDFEGSSFYLSNNLQYAYTNDWSLGADLGVTFSSTWKQTSYTKNGVAQTGSTTDKNAAYNSGEVKNSGLNDLILSSSYRVYDNNLKVDIKNSLLLPLGSADRGNQSYNSNLSQSSTTNGNVKNGGLVFDVVPTLSMNHGTFSWDAGLGVRYSGSRTINHKGSTVNSARTTTSDISIKAEARVDVVLTGGLNWMATDSFHLGVDLTSTSFSDVKENFSYVSDNDGATYKNNLLMKDRSETSIELSAKYQLNKSLAAKISYEAVSQDFNSVGSLDTNTNFDSSKYFENFASDMPMDRSVVSVGVDYWF